MKLLYISLPKIEIKIYLIIWLYAIGYAIYQVYKISAEYFSNDFIDVYDDFTDGWSWLERKKDNADVEWHYGLILLIDLLPWYAAHFIVAEILRTKVQLIPIWHSTIGSLFVINYLGFKPFFYLLSQPIISYIFLQFKSKPIIWFCNITSLSLIHYINWLDLDSSEFELHLIVTTLAWINLRCLNYFLDATTNANMQKINITNIIKVLAYCLYLPILFFGPLILYSDFNNRNINTSQDLFERSKRLIINLLRFGWWLLFMQFALHFIYVNALPYQIQLIGEINYFTLYGLGYCMGQFFHMKYVILYGLSTALTHFELGITVPQTPKCIGRIYLYSDMWKYFDRGLYVFLVKYIYKPCSESIKFGKIFGSFLCFSYVYIWHGIQNYILIWSCLNYIGVTIESTCVEISNTEAFKTFITNKLSAEMYRRLKCMLASPLFAMSALSNFYFFAGKDVGDLYVYRFFYGPIQTILMVLAVLYCGSRISIEVKQYEDTRLEQQQKSHTANTNHPQHNINLSKL